jgi:hypothetical protein
VLAKADPGPGEGMLTRCTPIELGVQRGRIILN